MELLPERKLLLLSVGYGKGHHSAAAALAEHYAEAGWNTQVVDVCEMAQPGVFRLTQIFYDFCVRRAPWLWGITYALTDSADWSRLIHSPLLRPVVRCLHKVLEEEKPDLVICTYPLFAYMLDELHLKGKFSRPYAVVVTDAREISRPWVRSHAMLVTVPDTGSRNMVVERYAMEPYRVVDAGFPVKSGFRPSVTRSVPGKDSLRVLYGAYRQIGGVINDIAILLAEFPRIELVVLAGSYCRKLQRVFRRQCETGRLQVLKETSDMPHLLSECHFYIGKAGAATMFECYACEVPVLINFTLPGQEQGNLELLLEDGAGCHVESTAHLVDVITRLLENNAAGWQSMRQRMVDARRQSGAACIKRTITQVLNI